MAEMIAGKAGHVNYNAIPVRIAGVVFFPFLLITSVRGVHRARGSVGRHDGGGGEGRQQGVRHRQVPVPCKLSCPHQRFVK